MEKKSFVFYLSWNEAIKELNEQQVRNFINNLCNYAEGKDVILNDLTEKILWSQTQPLLDYNEGKRQKRIENGKKGGLSKGTNTNQTQVHLTPLNSTNQIKVDLTPLTEEGRGMKDDGRGMKDDGRGMKVEGGVLLKTSEYRELLNELFVDVKDWESKINKIGITEFCRRYNCFDVETVTLLDEFIKS